MNDTEHDAFNRPGRARGLRRPRLRALPRGVRGRRRLQALAGEDGDRGRRPPLLPDHDEPPPAAPQRRLRRGSRSRARTSSSGRSSTRSRSGCRSPTSPARRSPTSRPRSSRTRTRSSTATRSTASPRCSTCARRSRSPTAAIVKVHTRVYKQDNTLVAEFKRAVLIPKRPNGESPTAEGDVD